MVGIGASAGGLEAFSQLLKGLPSDSGAAFVLVQHLDPIHESMLSTLLARETPLPVTEVIDGIPVQPNHVYVIPPNANMAILHGHLHLLPRATEPGPSLPIDYFFRSLAADQGSKAIGVILSGTASDGVLGLKEIKAAGGITFSQDESSAKYGGMPHSAIASGCVDFILPPKKIAAELARIGRHPYLTPPPGVVAEEGLPRGGKDFDKILILLRNRTGDDFTYYKQSTIKRRIKRRMLLHKVDRLPVYLKYLQDTPEELDALHQDILINVTSFFRDPEAFEHLKQHVFPNILKVRGSSGSFRIWVPGCSTGEEAYTVAICLLEFLGDQAYTGAIQIFATDIDEIAIDKARTGIYAESITHDVSPERLRRFFVKVDEGYQIAKHIRDMCIFAKQNVFRDPPFSKLDLISCRNLLIYLGPELQKKVLPIFHYFLRPNGYLLLGTSETVGKFSELFALKDKKQKIYLKKAAILAPAPEFNTRLRMTGQPATEDETEPSWTRSDLQQAVDQMVMHKYGPAGVVINHNFDILKFRGHTGPFLEPAPGEASLNVIKMARPGLSMDLRVALNRAAKENEPVSKEGVRVTQNDNIRIIDFEVTPLQAGTAGGHYFLVVFQEQKPPPVTTQSESKKRGANPVGAESARVRDLEQELAANKEYLQSAIEQHEVINEELKSANEEIQSSNEELQSTNEELETAKEELQSTNEELETVNDELAGRNITLEQLNNDLNNLITSIQLPVIMLGPDLRIRRFTPHAERLLRLGSSDIGRPVGQIESSIVPDSLGATVSEVIETMSRRSGTRTGATTPCRCGPTAPSTTRSTVR